MTFSAVELILKKRDGQALTEEEIVWFVERYSAGEIPDYQCSAFMMAVCLKDMSPEETAALTQAMVHSGSIVSLSDVQGPKVDKHSTGGVGDKTSLILAPIVASLGAVVPMMSGRGLGHTGGTLDKLESIAGFDVALSEMQFKNALRDVGAAIISTNADMCPADRKMYALRDVTGTVRGVPLQTASIMCKKLAENPDSLVLDVKTGAGAFNTDEAEAIRLAKSMIAAGERDGKATTAFVTAMDQPLGRAVGNWLEVAESIRTLRGEGPKDLEDLCVELAAQMLVQAHGASRGCGTRAEAAKLARGQLHNGEALKAFRKMVVAQGGDPTAVDDLTASAHSPSQPLGSSGGEVLIFQGVYGSKPCHSAPLDEVAKMAVATPMAAHGPFWGVPVHGMATVRDLDSFFMSSLGQVPTTEKGLVNHSADGSPTSKRAKLSNEPVGKQSMLERSKQAPHGPVVGYVERLDALVVGQACVAIGAGRQKLGEALTLGAGVLLHKKLGDSLREGDVLFTLFAEVGGNAQTPHGTRRVISHEDVNSACARIMGAFRFRTAGGPAASSSATGPPGTRAQMLYFVDRDGSVATM